MQDVSAYGEAKEASADNHGKGVDLVRLAIFGRGCIDTHMLNHVIIFYILNQPCYSFFFFEGESVTFFLYHYKQKQHTHVLNLHKSISPVL